MERVPSLHISTDQLAIILKEVLEDAQNIFLDSSECQDIAKEITLRGKTKSLTSRCLISSTQIMEKKTEKLKLAGRSEAGMFAQTLLYVRRLAKHRGISLITPSDRDWPHIKEICRLATDFCNEFGIPIKIGYKKYIEIGMSKMKNFSMFKFKNMHTDICKTYESMNELEADRDPQGTKDVMEYYSLMIYNKIGYLQDFNFPEKLVCFKRAREEADKMRVSYKNYIQAQFQGMEWRDAIPDPFQLYGEKAVDRAVKFCYGENISLKSNGGRLDISKIKRAK